MLPFCVLAAVVALVAVTVVRRRRLRAPAEVQTWPLDYIDSGGLAITKRDRGCSGTPTWQLLVTGALSPADVRTALVDLTARYPLLTAKVRALDGRPPWTTQYRYEQDPRFRVEDILRVVENPDIEALSREERSRHIDQFTQFPLTLTLALLGPDKCRLIFRQHHGIADGRAFIALLEDFALFLNAARAGQRPSARQLAPVPKRSEAEPLGLTPAKQALETIAGFGVLVRIHSYRLLFPLKRLIQNVGNDYSGDNATVHWSIPDSILNDWNAARRAAGVSLNSWITGAWFIALKRWHEARQAPVGRTSSLLLQETRPRDGSFVSFGNHLTFPEVELRLDRVEDVAAAAREVQSQMQRDRDRRTAVRRMLAERWLIGLVPLAILQLIALESPQPAQSTSVSNLIPLAFPTMEGPGWRVDEVLITTPVQPRTGISLTVIRYNGGLVFNLNHKTSAMPRAEVEALGREFAKALSAEAMGRWC